MMQQVATTAHDGQAMRIRLPRDQIATPAALAALARRPSLRNIFYDLVTIVTLCSCHVQTPPKIL